MLYPVAEGTAGLERALAELEAARKTIHEEQERLRANLNSVPGAGEGGPR